MGAYWGIVDVMEVSLVFSFFHVLSFVMTFAGAI